MNVKLTSDDRCAIDVALENRAQGDGSVAACFGRQAASIEKRMRAVETILGALDRLPAADPPANLVARTMKFIKKHEHDVISIPAARRPAAAIHGYTHRAMH